jgi:hypothetical protein
LPAEDDALLRVLAASSLLFDAIPGDAGFGCHDTGRRVAHSSDDGFATSRLICPTEQIGLIDFTAFTSRTRPHSAKTRARKNEFRELIQADLGCQFTTPKYFSF